MFLRNEKNSGERSSVINPGERSSVISRYLKGFCYVEEGAILIQNRINGENDKVLNI